MTEPSINRSDARRNRKRILAAARRAFEQPSGSPSMAEISRRAEVGMATLYRNLPTRLQLVEALYSAEVDAASTAPDPDSGATPGP